MREQEERRSVANRVRFFDHEGKAILLVDLSKCGAREVEQLTRKVPDLVTSQKLGSVLILTDFAGASFDNHALMSIKETAVFDKPYIKKSALIGTESLPREFYDEMKSFSRRDWMIFRNRQEALTWLVEDSARSTGAAKKL